MGMDWVWGISCTNSALLYSLIIADYAWNKKTGSCGAGLKVFALFPRKYFWLLS